MFLKKQISQEKTVPCECCLTFCKRYFASSKLPLFHFLWLMQWGLRCRVTSPCLWGLRCGAGYNSLYLYFLWLQRKNPCLPSPDRIDPAWVVCSNFPISMSKPQFQLQSPFCLIMSHSQVSGIKTHAFWGGGVNPPTFPQIERNSNSTFFSLPEWGKKKKEISVC